MKEINLKHPSIQLSLRVQVELTPDGVGYEASNMHADIIESTKTEINGDKQAPETSTEQVL
jgi:hypothetical protein